MGNECPLCDTKLTGRKCRGCGWTMAPEPTVMPTHNTCEGCGESGGRVSPFHPDLDDGAAPQDRGKRLCASCWIPALRRRYELDPITNDARGALIEKLVASLVGKFTLPAAAPAIQVAESTTPTCAGCGKADAAQSRDGRLWHTECWAGRGRSAA